MGIVEVLVALMIFAIVAIGMSYSLISMTRLTADASARETATNLAAAEIDRLHAITDAFTIEEDDLATRQVIVDGITYRIATNTSWVGANGSTGKCGIGGGQLQYKRIRVSVTWDNMYLDRRCVPTPRSPRAAASTTRRPAPSWSRSPRESGDRPAGHRCLGDQDQRRRRHQRGARPDRRRRLQLRAEGSSRYLQPDDAPKRLHQHHPAAAPGHAVHRRHRRGRDPGRAAGGPRADLHAEYAANSTRTVKLPTNLDVTYFGQSAAGPLTEPAPRPASSTRGPPATRRSPVTRPPAPRSTRRSGRSDHDRDAGARAFNVPGERRAARQPPAVMGVADVVIPGASTSNFYLTATAVSSTSGGNPGAATPRPPSTSSTAMRAVPRRRSRCRTACGS